MCVSYFSFALNLRTSRAWTIRASAEIPQGNCPNQPPALGCVRGRREQHVGNGGNHTKLVLRGNPSNGFIFLKLGGAEWISAATAPQPSAGSSSGRRFVSVV